MSPAVTHRSPLALSLASFSPLALLLLGACAPEPRPQPPAAPAAPTAATASAAPTGERKPTGSDAKALPVASGPVGASSGAAPVGSVSLAEGDVCDTAKGCGPGLACCYPCGRPGCQNKCFKLAPNEGCPRYP